LILPQFDKFAINYCRHIIHNAISAIRMFHSLFYCCTLQQMPCDDNQSLSPNINSPNQLAPGGASPH